MSRIGDALKRAGAPDVADGWADMSTVDVPLAESTLAVTPVSEPPDPAQPDPVRQKTPAAPVAPEPAELQQKWSADSDQPLSLLEAIASRSDKSVASPRVEPVAVEQYRRLAAILHHVQQERGIRRVLLASALAEEGKTLTSTNLALTLSESYRKRVLLVDADLRRPSVSLAFGLPKQAGLSEALSSEHHGKLALIALSERLWVLPAGEPTTDPMHGLTSTRMAQLLDEASENFDWVIVDSPPVGILSDAKLLARMVDTVVFVIAAGKTPFAAIQRATEAIGRDRILGVVLNQVGEGVAAPGGYEYHRYYHDGQGRRKGNTSFLRRVLRRK